MKKISIREKLRYEFDNIMSRGTPALIGWLGILSVVVIILFTILVWTMKVKPEDSDGSFLQLAWMSLMRIMDTGAVSSDKGVYAYYMLGVTLGGLFIMSTLIGIINNGIQNKLEDLRRGRSRVIESDHTVIVGWSEQIFTIVSELVEANLNRRKPRIVIMSRLDKVAMEEELRSRISDTKNTRVICRSGDPIDMSDLEMVSLDSSRSIIVLSPNDIDPDSDVIKTILAITNNPDRKSDPYHIVAEIRKPQNVDVAKIIGKDEVEIVLAGDLIARVIAQTCLQSGLSVVYTELLDFGGDEIYLKEEPALTGKTYKECIFMYEDSAVIGIAPKNGTSLINPPMDAVIKEGDKIIAISEDDDTVVLSGLKGYDIETSAVSSGGSAKAEPEHVLFLGWNWRAPVIIRELGNYIAEGSSIAIVADIPESQEDIRRILATNKGRIQKIKFVRADITDRTVLDGLNPQQYNHIIILCYSDTLDTQHADAKTLMTLLHLRDINEKTGSNMNIISEMLDIKNRDLAEVTKVNDFIVSGKLISLLMSQVSENKMLNHVFKDLFDPEGSEIYIKPAENYVNLGSNINFYTVLESAARKKETAIGYKIEKLAHDSTAQYGVVLNPEKSKKFTLSAKDKVIVLAES